MDITSIVIGFAIVLVSLTIHETAHAWTADRLGDPTARLLGRISLNPIVHIDLIGTVILPIVARISGLPILGWAKPVPVNITRLRHPRRDFVLVAAAGPMSNLALAALAAIPFRLTAPAGLDLYGYFRSGGPAVPQLFFDFVEINLVLAVFNMIPIPPLDGGNVLAGLLPPSAAGILTSLRQYGFLILYALILTNVLNTLIWPPTLFLIQLLLQ